MRPLKEVYSGALPAMQPRSNNEVLKPRKIRSEWATGVRRSATGRPFQAVGPATEKALSDNKQSAFGGPATPPGQNSAMIYDAE